MVLGRVLLCVRVPCVVRVVGGVVRLEKNTRLINAQIVVHKNARKQQQQHKTEVLHPHTRALVFFSVPHRKRSTRHPSIARVSRLLQSRHTVHMNHTAMATVAAAQPRRSGRVSPPTFKCKEEPGVCARVCVRVPMRVPWHGACCPHAPAPDRAQPCQLWRGKISHAHAAAACVGTHKSGKRARRSGPRGTSPAASPPKMNTADMADPTTPTNKRARTESASAPPSRSHKKPARGKQILFARKSSRVPMAESKVCLPGVVVVVVVVCVEGEGEGEGELLAVRRGGA